MHAEAVCCMMFQSKFGGAASGPQKTRRVRPIKSLSLVSGRKNHILKADYLSRSLSVLQLFSLTFVLRCFACDKLLVPPATLHFLGQQVFKGAQRPRPDEKGHRVISDTCIYYCM